MIELLESWLRPLLAGALLSSLIAALIPEGRTKGTLRFVLGLLMTVLLLQPIRLMKTEWNAEWFSLERLEAAGFRQEMAEVTQELTESFIKREAEEYIWNAAERIGIRELGVRIALRAGECGPVPYEISLRGCWTEEQKTALAFLLEGELGIPQERQDWSSGNACESEESGEGP